MAVKCANCGEELLGAVNRCWHCGTEMESRPGNTSLPPVRRAPVPQSPDIVSTVVTDAGDCGDSADSGEVVQAVLADGMTAKAPPSDQPPPSEEPSGQTDANPPIVARRVGSPFARPVTASGDGPIERPSPPKTHYVVRQAKYPRHLASVGGSLAALVLGIMSLIACFYTSGAVVTAVIGLLMGIWGLYSTRRGPAVIGILLCCIAMAIGGFNGVVWTYEAHYGYKPWDAPSGYETLEGGYEEDVGDF